METTARDDEDLDLAGRVLQGDEEAFSRLVRKHHPRVFRLVRGIVGDWHRSEDVCQEVFTTVYLKLAGFRRSSRFSTWLYRVAVNAAIKARKRGRRQQGETLDSIGDIPGPLDGREARVEGDEVLRKLLLPLPEKLRVVVSLREQAGLSYDEISKVVGCSRGAVEQRLHRAMVALREIWNAGGRSEH